eukprot:703164-Rhodomonas_salina.1
MEIAAMKGEEGKEEAGEGKEVEEVEEGEKEEKKKERNVVAEEAAQPIEVPYPPTRPLRHVRPSVWWYLATRCAVLTWRMLLSTYAMCGTDLALGAMRCA